MDHAAEFFRQTRNAMQQSLEAATLVVVRSRLKLLFRDADHLRLKALRRTRTPLLAAEVCQKPVPSDAAQPRAKSPSRRKLLKSRHAVMNTSCAKSSASEML